MTENTVIKKGLNAEDYVQLIKVFTLSLEGHREVMNSLNVFPVPDADTGTNMYISVKGIMDSLDNADPHHDLNVLSKDIANYALLSAQGNSGLLIAQLFRGIHKGVSSSNILGLSELAESLEQSYEYAFSSIHEPQEGTMITVMRECAKIARKYLDTKNSDFKKALEAISSRAKSAVEETKGQMELLKQADVIDSGAYGFSVMLEAAHNCVESDQNGNINLRVDGTNSFIPQIPNYYSPKEDFFLSSSHDEDWGYCVVFALSGNNLDSEEIKKQLTDKGRSLVVSGTEDVVKIHIHSENPDQVVDFSRKFGDVSNENITNMDEQFDEMKNKVTQKFENEVSIVAVTSGEGIVSFLKKNTFGTIEFISNDELKNMDNNKFNKFISTISSKKIILFGNSLQAFKDLYELSSDDNKKLNVIKSTNDSELVSCVFAFSPEIDIKENLININSSLEENITFEIKEDNLESSMITSLVKDLDNRFIIIYHHEDKLESAKKIEKVLQDNYKIDGVEFISHTSSEYDFLISVE
ncbi:MAG: hypothetical protein CL762_04460 [Chloroflexi bacterium]|nr:hypothetical protein [Chloroflexota bacterium]|tara:strand:+ start:13047 stop:14621 length:1575 start_codon:yes stop_codon:yes gene_type:complete